MNERPRHNTRAGQRDDEKERQRKSARVVCVHMRARERESVCVCVRERERERGGGENFVIGEENGGVGLGGDAREAQRGVVALPSIRYYQLP